MADLTYEVTVRGVASDMVRAAFADCEIATGPTTTTVRCRHGALRVVLNRIQDLGLDLLELASGDPPGSDG